ncbi:MAG: MarR family transcriptional regulator [Pseudomonadota bacterium]
MSYSETVEVAGRCLCFRTQRAARILARRFDQAFKPHGLTNGQFSLLMALNRPEPAAMGPLADFLGMDRTTLTAALKPLQRRGLVESKANAKDKRVRGLITTDQGRALIAQLLPIWRAEHDRLDAELSWLGTTPATLRDGLGAIGSMGREATKDETAPNGGRR